MGRIDEEYVTNARLRLVQTRFQLIVMEGSLGSHMLGQVFLGGTGMARTRWHFIPMPFMNSRT